MGEYCIYKLPDPLRKLNEEAHNPQVISIGPFHYGNKKLKIMEKHKASYLEAFIKRAKINICKEDLEHAVKGFEKSVRHCYAETIDHLNSDDFVTMILTDASFIIELFIRNMFGHWSSDDKIKLKPWLAARMQLDFILLENQLHFFIIDKLFDLAFPSGSGLPSFVELTFEYFSSYNRQKMSPCPKSEIFHFADLLRKFYLPPCLPYREPKIIEHMYTATQLVEVGLKFEADRSSNCLLALDYKKGVLKISRFILEDDIELYVRNILALEQCHYPNQEYVTDYFILLDFLLNGGEKDLGLLRQQGILVIGFGNKYITNFINNLGTGMINSTMNSKYYDICIKLRKFYEEPGWLEYIHA
ncbi:UPF0481 protein At3g47200-like [Alnus glutinosa]|uniref:UPF0481 protein At3g47200-like n=1 Tax=Alnus glutinosa TaxID=3517 RepID=UPI002D77E590|nr:UPF0481 protein At3g47200-like [Alnus glutinosa]